MPVWDAGSCCFLAGFVSLGLRPHSASCKGCNCVDACAVDGVCVRRTPEPSGAHGQGPGRARGLPLLRQCRALWPGGSRRVHQHCPTRRALTLPNLPSQASSSISRQLCRWPASPGRRGSHRLGGEGTGRAVLRAEAATMSRNGKLKSCLWNFLLSHKLAWVKGQMARCCCQTSGCFPCPRLRGPRLGRACWMASLCVLCSGRAWDAFEIRIFYSMIKF